MTDGIAEPEKKTLAELGLDEAWLEKWLQAAPRRLGLGGNVKIVRAQLTRSTGSGSARLDLQAIDENIEDRVYDIELQRGMLDADHGFRALDYWAREQKTDDSGREHRPVIISEGVRGTRYWNLLEVLSEKLGLIVLEARAARVDGKPVVWIDPVVLPEDLQPDKSGEIHAVHDSLTEESWMVKTTEDFQGFLKAFRGELKRLGLDQTVVWSAKSYIGLWKNSRCWCPIWPRKEAMARVYLPKPESWEDGDEENAPKEFHRYKEGLLKSDVTLVWAWKYNMGSNPLGITLEAEDLTNPLVQELLRDSWKTL